MTTQSLLDRAAEFDKGTPPGEWCDDGDMIGTRAKINGNVVCVAPDDRLGGSRALWPANKRAIIDARSLVPELAAELRRVTEWRDISTAPKDGTRILGWFPVGGARTTLWLGDSWMARGSTDNLPTHWRELPKGPTT